ncbi:hypothetical protein ACFQNE_16840 [Gordonia phosphorivorans]|uniref:DUF4352 domain-containing protein n=1 Tax=Gordonia phosphorivorans TaxID=1056982 RepID=A0ABV6HCF9_9ACTN
MRFNPPPNWPRPPHPDWQPPADWHPDPRWGPPPPGWSRWVDEPRPASALRRRLTHPVWATVATLVTVVGIVLAVLPTLGSGDVPDAEFAAVSLSRPVDITAEEFNVSSHDRITRPDISASSVDLTIKNNTDVPLAYSRLEAELLGESSWDCHRSGGEVVVDASYAVSLPWGPGNSGLQSTELPIDFTVPPEAAARMDMTIGPDRETYGIMLFAVRVTLYAEGAGTLTTPPLVLLTEPKSTENHLEWARKQVGFRLGEQCLAEYLADVDAFIDRDALVSPAAEEWLAGLRSMKD